MTNDIKEMLKDLNNHKRPRQEILSEFISYRLNKSIQTYYKQLSDSVDYLALAQDPDNIIIKLSKEDLN